MPSRFWLFLAFLLAFGASPAQAETAPKRVAAALDQAMVENPSPGVSTVVIGNPRIGDATM